MESSVEMLYQPSEQFDLLQGFGVCPKVAEGIDKLHQEGLLPADLSDQVIDAFREMPEHQALQVLDVFKNSNLTTVNNRNAFLLGLIKQSYKTKQEPLLGGGVGIGGGTISSMAAPSSQLSSTGGGISQFGSEAAENEFTYGTESDGMDYDAGFMSGGQQASNGGMYGMGGMHGNVQGGGMYDNYHQPAAKPRSMKCGPDPEAMAQILARTGYSHEITPSLRRYGGPPPDWTGPKPTQGVEVFLGKLPEDLFEDELIPLMEKCGKIYELRVIVDKEGYNRGFGFVTFCDKESAKNAVNTYNNFRVRGRRIVANLNVQFTKLYVGGIPKDKTREQIFSAFGQEVDKLTDVVIQESDDPVSTTNQNRGYCFLEFDSYFDAAAARRKLMSNRSCIRAWDNYRKFKVDWAIPLENPDEAVANRSTVILVTHLNDSITSADLREKFEKYGVIKSCNKTGQHAFITFAERSSAEKATETENHQFIKDAQIEVTIHVPLTTVAKRMVEAIKGPRGGGSGGGGFGMSSRGAPSSGFRNRRGGPAQYDVYGSPSRGGGFGGFGGGRGGGAGGRRQHPFNPLERAGTFTRARMMTRGGGIFSDRNAGFQPQTNPYGLQRGSGIVKNKQRGGGILGGSAVGYVAGGMGGGNAYSMQNTYSQLGSSFTQF